MTRILSILLISFFSSEVIGSGYFDKVPTASIEFNGEKQNSAVGTFCWHFPLEASMCVDTGLVSPNIPLSVNSNPTFLVTMPNHKDLMLIQYSVVAVSDDLAMKNDSAPERIDWDAGFKNVSELKVSKKLEIKLDLKPGLYVLNVMAWWKNHNDASHGFLVSVAP